jgi:uncharacterized protein with ParB-like and HNH nuclease domain
MDAAEAKIQKVLQGDKQFLVPHFQRPYSWQEREWRVLWDDLVELVGDDDPRPHFLGSIVTAPARAVPEGVEKRLLIDGQQRLTTIVLLLGLIRERAIAGGNGKVADRVVDLILNRHEDGADRYKLQPTQGETVEDSDRDALTAIIDGREHTSTSGIQAARVYFSNKLSRSDAPGLDALLRVITNKLTLISIILDEKDNPHRIFESLNGKGRPLSQADLIRNYFFMRLPASEHEAVYRGLWQPMQRRVGEDNLTEFIRHYLMHLGQVVKESDIYSTLKERFDRSDRTPRQHLEELARFAGYYEVLLHPETATNAGIRERLGRLRQLEVTVAYPLLLPLYGEVASGALSAEQLCEVLDVVETYVVRRFVCGVPTHGLNKVFTPLYQQARKQADVVGAIKTILAERGCPSDDEFRDRLDTARLYGPGERRTKTLIMLGRIEAALGHKELVDTSVLTIEHVMPQTPTDWWKAHLGDDWEEDHDQLLHTLGNLTLTSYNPELSNKAFPEKRSILAKSHVELNRYFDDVEHWNEGEIQRRADALADVALTVWPYFGPDREEAARPRSSAARPEMVDVTSTVPQVVVFRGERIPVRSWREVLTVTLEKIIATMPDDFAMVVKELGRVVAIDPATFKRTRRPMRLSNGAYVETNLAAAKVYRNCLQALQAVGLGPDEWQVQRVSLGAEPEDADDEPSETRQLQLDFWIQARAALDATGAFSSLPSPRPRHWFDITIGRSGYWLALNANVAHGKLAVKLMLTEDEAAAMPLLAAQRAAIESEIGAALEWNPHPDKKFKAIRLTRPTPFADRGAWPDAIAWLTRTTIAFKRAFAPRIQSLEFETPSPAATAGGTAKGV